jgi:hypothetical protein
MYAIEEYGKAEILRNYMLENKSKYSIPGGIFGKGKFGSGAHNAKLEKGLENLPPICKILSPAIEITTNKNSEFGQEIVIKRDGIQIGRISRAPNTTGIFQDTTKIPDRSVDIDLKTACFYIDWDNTDGNWKFILPPDKEQLVYNIERMKEAVTHHKS